DTRKPAALSTAAPWRIVCEWTPAPASAAPPTRSCACPHRQARYLSHRLFSFEPLPFVHSSINRFRKPGAILLLGLHINKRDMLARKEKLRPRHPPDGSAGRFA